MTLVAIFFFSELSTLHCPQAPFKMGPKLFTGDFVWNWTLGWSSLPHFTQDFLWEHFLASHLQENLELWTNSWERWTKLPHSLPASPHSQHSWWRSCLEVYCWGQELSHTGPPPSKFYRARIIYLFVCIAIYSKLRKFPDFVSCRMNEHSPNFCLPLGSFSVYFPLREGVNQDMEEEKELQSIH